MELLRTAGQSPMLPGAIRAGDMVYTSGIVAPEVLAGGRDVPFGSQADSAMQALLGTLAGAGVGPAGVVKVEAFLASPDDFAAWNDVFVSVWPEPGPARTTLISAFAVSGVLIELQAVGVAERGR